MFRWGLDTVVCFCKHGYAFDGSVHIGKVVDKPRGY